MSNFKTPLDKYSVTERLFALIDDLSPDMQFILYKQLVKDNITSQLFKLIIDMSDEEKKQLLKNLGEVTSEDEPVRTVNLDENDSFMRKNLRKNCLIAVNCRIAGTSFKSDIINISLEGVFIEAKDRYPIGQKMAMSFRLPNYAAALEIDGRVSRSGLQGIGVSFSGLSQIQQDIIQTYIAEK